MRAHSTAVPFFAALIIVNVIAYYLALGSGPESGLLRSASTTIIERFWLQSARRGQVAGGTDVDYATKRRGM